MLSDAFFITTNYIPFILVLLVISYFRNLPKIRRVDAALALLALFSAVHLYVPSMSFVTFGKSSWDPS